jgi:ribosomal subunit interface protein
MKHTVEFKNWTPDAEVRELLETQIGRLERLAKSLPQESLSLRVVVERNETRTLYGVSITLELPGPNLSTNEERHDLREAIRDAFAELRRQLEKYREKLTHAPEYKRPARRAQLKGLPVAAATGTRRKPR